MNTTSNDFQVGEIYYRLTYPDPGLLYPKVETFVFIGKNLSDEDTQETWYFEFSDSYAKSKSSRASKDFERKVCMATRDELDDMLDLTGLIRELELACTRRAKP